jgi:lipid-binding SYLF domain-containing protein
MFKALCASFLLLMMSIPQGAVADSKADKERAEIRKASKTTLEQLYKSSPESKALIAKSVGYATFSNFGMKILFVGGGSGKGLVVDNSSKQEIFMRMAEAQAGLGMGAKKFRVVFVFTTPEALKSFVDQGWTMGGQATAAAKKGEEGAAAQGAAAVSPGVYMYQLTDTGLAAEITAKGTKYWKDSDLN